MAYDPDLLDQLENLGSETFSGEVFRYTGGRRRPDQENTVGARWNPPEVAAIYTALDLDTLMAEFEHHLAALSPAPKRDAFTLYSLHVEIENVVDLREPTIPLRAQARRQQPGHLPAPAGVGIQISNRFDWSYAVSIPTRSRMIVDIAPRGTRSIMAPAPPSLTDGTRRCL